MTHLPSKLLSACTLFILILAINAECSPSALLTAEPLFVTGDDMAGDVIAGDASAADATAADATAADAADPPGDDSAKPGDEEDDDEEIPLPPSDNFEIPDSVPAEQQATLQRAIDRCKQVCAYPDPEPLRNAAKMMEEMKSALPRLHLPPYYLGLVRMRQRDYAKARTELNAAIQILPGFYEAYYQLGDVACMEHAFEKAIPNYEKALEIYPYHLGSTESLANALISVGRFADARVYLDRALKRWTPNSLLELSEELNLVINGPPWKGTYTVESDNYIVKTCVSQELAQTAADTAELIRKIYDKVFPDIPKPDRKYLVFIFDDYETYMKCGAPDNTAGFYDPRFRRLSLCIQKTMDDTLMVLKHEGFHQYCHEYLNNIPTWFNEGLADYFGASEPYEEKGKIRGMRMIVHSWCIEDIGEAVANNETPPVEKLMLMSHEEMYEEKHIYLHYAQAWSLCHFCIDGGNPQYQSTLKKYFKSLTNGKDQEEAYKASFGKLSMQEFETRWKDHVRKLYNEWKADNRH